MRTIGLRSFLIVAIGIGLSAQFVRAADSPVIPGFERFHSTDRSADVDGGRLLIHELNCASCHEELKPSNPDLPARKAPILSNVGARIHADYLMAYIADPQKTKPGTTMPNVFGDMNGQQRTDAAEALTQFLASTGSVVQIPPNKGAVKKGEQLFHTVGCLACHNSRKPGAQQLPTSVPLVDLDKKYSVGSLMAFLKDPHAARPSGRMPNLNLNDQEIGQIASYFLKDVEVPANVNYAYYEGNWDKVPDFSAIKPKAEGQTAGIDVSVRERNDGFGLRFEGYLHVQEAGPAVFHLGSDDGSRLSVDGEEIVLVDGVHPYREQKGKVVLQSGPHKVVIDYFEGSGEERLTADVKLKGGTKQPLGNLLTPTAEPVSARETLATSFDPDLIARGRSLFASLGCASCHEMKIDGQQITSTREIQPIAGTRGCLKGQASAPQFALSDRQRAAIGKAIAEGGSFTTDPKSTIHLTMKTMNCYACHKRGDIGGVERSRDADFKTKIPEMGDEGRVPPPLDGVGDKLNAKWLKHLMDNGANDRPYMLARMPKFGRANAGKIVEAFATVDQKTKAKDVKFTQAAHRVQSAGRSMVGSKGGLGCVKCHYFDKHKAEGIQALDLTKMTQRLRKDWFQRYMLDPQAYRSGTRMPTGFPNGQSVLPNVLDGLPDTQVAAMWEYLSLGNKAPVPAGLSGGTIELIPKGEPIIYRNFIEGLSPRGIAVGYPEKAHLAYDAEWFSISLIWHGAFIDASRHWNGRGQGNQPPLGDHVVPLDRGTPFARLKSADSPWPAMPPREAGYRFKGYWLDEKGRPKFRYEFDGVTVEDHPVPVPGDKFASFDRTITLMSDIDQSVWFRAAKAKSIERDTTGWFVIDNAIRIQLSAGNSDPIIRESNGKKELLVRVLVSDGKAVLTEKIDW